MRALLVTLMLAYASIVFSQSNSSKGFVVYSNSDKILLLFIGQSCGKTETDIQRIYYSEKSMSQFFNEVEICKGNKNSMKSYYIKAKRETHYYLYAGGITSDDFDTFTGLFNMRLVYPSVSPNTSLNIGISYTSDREFITYKPFPGGGMYNYTRYRDLFEIPVTIQYNIGKNSVQPYFNAGISLLYYDRTPHPMELFNRNKPSGLGVTYMLAAGIEATIIKRILLKVDYRVDFSQSSRLPTIGIGYWLK